ncbi:MAG: hypothetical protein COA84_15690 [Robiginitomaculum sp.]|nr:MAG: hypothetical protein COA84_15690 [Robiginitomaculum sp.]
MMVFNFIKRERANIIWFGLVGLCLAGLALAIPFARNEMRASKARQVLDLARLAEGEERIQYLLGAKLALTPEGPSGDLYDLSAQLALLQTPMDLKSAERLSWDALKRSPARADSWARLAYIERQRSGRLNEKALTYLDHSFVVEPAGFKDFMTWRLEFMFAHWSQLPPSLQDATLRSLQMLSFWRGPAFSLKLVQGYGDANLTRRAQIVLYGAARP